MSLKGRARLIDIGGGHWFLLQLDRHFSLGSLSNERRSYRIKVKDAGLKST